MEGCGLTDAWVESNILGPNSCDQVVPLDMKGCICLFEKWQIHPFISKETKSWQAKVTNEPYLLTS